MVAAQVFIALCLASMAVAAPQISGLRSVSTTRKIVTPNINQKQVVTNVVSALQPSIAQAVAEAFAGLLTSSFPSASPQVSPSSSIQDSLSLSSSSLAADPSSQQIVSANAPPAAFEAAVSADAGPITKPEYNFEYSVADNDSQTYISQSEKREGDKVTGTYSYVDPNGALITVHYEAGPEGYTQTLDKQDGFVLIRDQPVKAAASITFTSRASVSNVPSYSQVFSFSDAASNTGLASNLEVPGTSYPSIEQYDLISRIISSLQPQLDYTVKNAISSARSTDIVEIAPQRFVAPVAYAGEEVTSTFGDGDTPEFNIAY